MPKDLSYQDEAAAGYDRAFARVTTRFVPFLLRAAHVAPGMRVLDIATGTGLAAKAALGVVGANGHVTAADLSPAMVEKARLRLGGATQPMIAAFRDALPKLGWTEGRNLRIESLGRL
jgi:ubiquinone/menaquinone biosynthesis C-methylase UbiE